MRKSKIGFFTPLIRRKSYEGKKGVSGYRKYRHEIAADCNSRCVYCSCHSRDLGGEEVMELDHFRPSSLFEKLKLDPTNLVYSCRSCNGKKSDDWPAGKAPRATTKKGIGYVDPFAKNRGEFFSVDSRGRVTAKKPPAQYAIERLGINRSLLRNLRYRELLFERLAPIMKKLDPVLEKTRVERESIPSQEVERLVVLAKITRQLLIMQAEGRLPL